MNYAQAFQHIRAALQPLYDADEAAAIAKRYLTGVTGLEYSTGLAQTRELDSELAARIGYDEAELLHGRPLQYILGYEEFLGRRFSVNEAVLIPRPETEELVQWVVEECRDAKRILDVGTGSGCIAVSIALALPNAQIWALDVSEAALAVARNNASNLGARAEFLALDALEKSAWESLPQFDVIVSNPPYIPVAESTGLHPNVREWEPHTALFVPDNDPLVFYRALAEMGREKMTTGCRIYCELQSDRAEAAAALFQSLGYEAEFRQDGFGLWRMLRAVCG